MTDAPLAPVVPPTPGDPQVGPAGSPAKPYVEFPTDLILKVKWGGAVAIVTIANSPQASLGLQIADPGSDGAIIANYGFDPPYTDGTVYAPDRNPGDTIDKKQYLGTGIYWDNSNHTGPVFLPLATLAPAQGAWIDYASAGGSVFGQDQIDVENSFIAFWSSNGPNALNPQPPSSVGFDGLRTIDCGVPVVSQEEFLFIAQYHISNVDAGGYPVFANEGSAVTVGGPSPQNFFLVNFGAPATPPGAPPAKAIKTVNIVQPGGWSTTVHYPLIVSVPFTCNLVGNDFVAPTYPTTLPDFFLLSSTDYRYSSSSPVPASHSKVTVAVYAGGTFRVNPDQSIGNTGGKLLWTDSRNIPDGGAVGSALGSFNAKGFLTPPPPP